MNRSTLTALARLFALAAALGLAACDDGGADSQPPAADAGPPDTPVPDVTLGVPADARACEVMFHDPARRVAAVSFGAAVEGRELRRGDRLAVAFAHRADAPFAADALALATSGDAAAVQIESTACFDREGRAIAGAALTLTAR